MALENTYTTHLFSYRFEGKVYTVDIVAANADEAKARLKALAWAQYDGELVARIPARLGLLTRLTVAVRNMAHTTLRRFG